MKILILTILTMSTNMCSVFSSDSESEWIIQNDTSGLGSEDVYNDIVFNNDNFSEVSGSGRNDNFNEVSGSSSEDDYMEITSGSGSIDNKNTNKNNSKNKHSYYYIIIIVVAVICIGFVVGFTCKLYSINNSPVYPRTLRRNNRPRDIDEIPNKSYMENVIQSNKNPDRMYTFKGNTSICSDV